MINFSLYLFIVIVFLPGVLLYDQYFDFYPSYYQHRRYQRDPPHNRGRGNKGRGHGPPDFARNHGHGPGNHHHGPPPFAQGHGHPHYDSSSEEDYDYHEIQIQTTKKPTHTSPSYQPLKTTSTSTTTDYSGLIDVRFGDRSRRSTKPNTETTEVLSRFNSLNHYPMWNTPDPNFKPHFYHQPHRTTCVEKKSECIPAFKCKTPPNRNSQFGFCRWVHDEPYVCCEKPKEKLQNFDGKCGRRENNKSQAIIGGVALDDGTKYPWMVAVGEKIDTNNTIDWYCGGALIGGKTVITAAHCVSKRKADIIRIGDIDLTIKIDKSQNLQERIICETLIHPLYKSPLLYNDLALLYLDESVNFSPLSRPVCLPDKSGQEIALLTGWGQLGFASERSAILQEVTVKVFNNTYCNQQYSITQASKRNFPRGILDTQLCAGDDQGGKDACQGDSGSPLVSEEEGNFVLIGLVSAGIGCGSKTFPGVYTRIAAFTPWILENIR